MAHNKQTFEDEQFSRDFAGRPAFPPPKLWPCPACGYEDHEVCKLLGHTYPIRGPQGNDCGTENAGENATAKPLKGQASK